MIWLFVKDVVKILWFLTSIAVSDFKTLNTKVGESRMVFFISFLIFLLLSDFRILPFVFIKFSYLSLFTLSLLYTDKNIRVITFPFLPIGHIDPLFVFFLVLFCFVTVGQFGFISFICQVLHSFHLTTYMNSYLSLVKKKKKKKK